jgi:predicted metal-dependent phosphoesterase TrpH
MTGRPPSPQEAEPRDAGALRSFLDLHVHTRASFDSLASPSAVVRAAAARGLTHVAITDHDRIDGALEAREAATRLGAGAPQVIVGEEIRTAEGDLIAVFLERAVPPGMPVRDTIAAVREQGGLVGIPHPFDRLRGSLLRDAGLLDLCSLVDWIEAHNARLVGRGNERAALLAREQGLPGVAVSDAHSVIEVGVAYTAVSGDPSTPAGLLAALGALELVPGRATMLVRVLTPIARTINRVRGNRRVTRVTTGSSGRALVP